MMATPSLKHNNVLRNLNHAKPSQLENHSLLCCSAQDSTVTGPSSWCWIMQRRKTQSWLRSGGWGAAPSPAVPRLHCAGSRGAGGSWRARAWLERWLEARVVLRRLHSRWVQHLLLHCRPYFNKSSYHDLLLAAAKCSGQAALAASSTFPDFQFSFQKHNMNPICLPCLGLHHILSQKVFYILVKFLVFSSQSFQHYSSGP